MSANRNLPLSTTSIFWRESRHHANVCIRRLSPHHTRGSYWSSILPLFCAAPFILAAPTATSLHAQTIGVTSPTPRTDSTSEALTLRNVLERALTQYPAIDAARARTRAARGSRVTAGTFANPMLSYQVDNTPFPGGSPIPGLDREAMTMVSFPLEPLYQRGSRIRRANADVRAAEADALTTRQRVALDAADAFYRTAAAQIHLSADRDLVSWLDSLVTYNRARVSHGAAAEADLIRSELERDRAAADAAMDAADLARARADLGAFLGDTEVGSATQPVAANHLPFDLASATTDVGNSPSASSTKSGSPLLRAALDARPDIQAARARVQAARAGVASEHSMLFRQLGATIGTKQMAGTTSMIAGVSLPFPLFDQNRGEVTRATAERDAAEFEVAARERTARAEIAGTYEAARVLTEQVHALTQPGPQNYLARATEARRITLGAYREGAVPLLQVLDAARAWEDAQVTFYRVLFAQHQSVLALRAAEGVDIMTSLPGNPSNVSH